ncbi:MAG: peptidylprolyl isomerase [Bacilli bacterium]
MIKLEIPGYGDITLELDYDNAPISSKNFEDLVKKGFYDGLTFHRVIKGFMIQGGCPHGTGTGGPGYTIKGEFKANGIDNPIKHTRGTLSMARASDPNSAGSQFFIMHKDAPYLDGSYAAFGHVVDGIEVVDKIASTRTGANDRPLERVIIARAYII